MTEQPELNERPSTRRLLAWLDLEALEPLTNRGRFVHAADINTTVVDAMGADAIRLIAIDALAQQLIDELARLDAVTVELGDTLIAGSSPSSPPRPAADRMTFDGPSGLEFTEEHAGWWRVDLHGDRIGRVQYRTFWRPGWTAETPDFSMVRRRRSMLDAARWLIGQVPSS